MKHLLSLCGPRMENLNPHVSGRWSVFVRHAIHSERQKEDRDEIMDLHREALRQYEPRSADKLIAAVFYASLGR